MKFTFVILDDNPEIEKTIEFALRNHYDYECITTEQISECTGEYIFYPDNTYNPIGLRKACEWIEQYPGRDVYYPCVLNMHHPSNKVSGRTVEHTNAGVRIEHSAPMNVIYRADFAKWLEWDKYGWFKYMLILSATTVRTTKINTKIFIGSMNLQYLTFYEPAGLQEALRDIRMFRSVAREYGVSGRTATLLEWRMDIALRIAWREVEKSENPEPIKQRLREFIGEPI